jgi:hypothetical protein
MTQAEISGISPFFIVSHVPSSLSFYRDRLGFEITFQGSAPDDIFFWDKWSHRRRSVPPYSVSNAKLISMRSWDALDLSFVVVHAKEIHNGPVPSR